MFINFDKTKRGALSIDEVDKNIKDVLNMDELFELKPVLTKGF